MFWSLFIFLRHSIQEPASIVCNNEQGDPFYSAGKQEPVLAASSTGKPQERFGKNADVSTRRVEISQKSLATGTACVANGYISMYTDLLQAEKGEPFNSVFSTEGSSISASTCVCVCVWGGEGGVMIGWEALFSNP